MATKTVTSKNTSYGNIQRGNSFIIPVIVKTDQDEALDLKGYKAALTVKKVQADFDRHDDFAYIKKDIDIQSPEAGSFFFQLSSYDTDFEPGSYYFDIELYHPENGMVWRLCTLNFELVGGPTNRHVNKNMGQLPVGDTVTAIALTEGGQVVVIAPTLNLDGDIYSQLATVMEQMDACKSAVETLEDTVSSQGRYIDQLIREMTELKERFGVL